MIELQLTQGSAEWLAARRKYLTASEAPAMMGVSSYMTRGELLRQKATGIVPAHDAATQARFNAGHEAEEKCRPLAEEIIGEELYPIVAASDCGKYLASSDGATMLADTGWEHKLLNASLAEAVAGSVVPDSHKWQLVHQCLVFGFKRILFSVSDGTKENHFYCWFEPTQDDIQRLIAGWHQFEKDLADYKPSEVIDAPKADAIPDLPTLFVHAQGAITAHNMDEFGSALTRRLAETRAIVLVTDQDFSNAKEAAKKFRETAQKIALAKKEMLEKTKTIGEAVQKMDAWAEDLNKTALQLEKDVKREDQAKKDSMILAAKSAYTDHVSALEAEISPIRLGIAAPDFSEAIKSKRNYSSMQDAVDTMLAGAKIAADSAAKSVREKLAWCKEHAACHGHLFPDLQQIISKPLEDFLLIISSRIEKAKADEAERIEAERQRIRAEEEARARRIAQEEQDKARREAERAEAEARRQAEDAEAAERKRAEAAACAIQAEEKPADTASKPFAAEAPAITEAPAVEIDDQRRIKLGEIGERLGFAVTAAFLSDLGFDPVATEKSAKLYRFADFRPICAKIIERVRAASVSAD